MRLRPWLLWRPLRLWIEPGLVRSPLRLWLRTWLLWLTLWLESLWLWSRLLALWLRSTLWLLRLRTRLLLLALRFKPLRFRTWLLRTWLFLLALWLKPLRFRTRLLALWLLLALRLLPYWFIPWLFSTAWHWAALWLISTVRSLSRVTLIYPARYCAVRGSLGIVPWSYYPCIIGSHALHVLPECGLSVAPLGGYSFRTAYCSWRLHHISWAGRVNGSPVHVRTIYAYSIVLYGCCSGPVTWCNMVYLYGGMSYSLYSRCAGAVVILHMRMIIYVYVVDDCGLVNVGTVI